MINAAQKSLVVSTFRAVADLPQGMVANIFYNNLFERAPVLRSLFRTDMMSQGESLMKALTYVVDRIESTDPKTQEEMVTALQSLGVRHVRYGVPHDSPYYATVGGALLQTLEAGLGDAFTEEVREAWTAAYALIVSVMTEAAKLAPTRKNPTSGPAPVQHGA